MAPSGIGVGSGAGVRGWKFRWAGTGGRLAVGVLGLVVTLARVLEVPEPGEQSGTKELESSAELVLSGQEDG